MAVFQGSGATRVIVIGAGVVGVATAYALALRGMAVTIIDRAELPGSGASFANGAQLSYVYTDALASPALLRHMPALALGLDPAFRLRPSFDLGQIPWLIRFMRNSTSVRFRENTLAGLELGLQSRLAMHALLERHPLDFGHAVAGKMLVYASSDSFNAARKMVELKRANGAVQQILSPDEAVHMEPALAAREDAFAGAIFSPQEELGDPHRFCNSLMRVLQSEYGVRVCMGTTVAKWEEHPQGICAVTEQGERIEADQLVICAGIDAQRLLPGLGLGSALMPMKGYSFTAPPGNATPAMSITDVARKIVFCPLDGKVRVAGLAELGARDTRVDANRLADLKSSAAASLPAGANYAATGPGWAGIRPMTANSLPIIQRVRPRVSINIGHGMLGWTYAMGSGERAASLMEL
jgi:D-amino-acid dehydrogenase